MMDGGNSSRSNRNTVDRASTEVIDGPGDNGHRLPPQSTLPKSAREIQLLSDDYADLELRCREIQVSHAFHYELYRIPICDSHTISEAQATNICYFTVFFQNG